MGIQSIMFAQVISTTPYFPTDDQPVRVTFYAQQGNAGLAGYTGDVYAHTGVITNLSTNPSDWKYVKTDWGENTPETKLTRISTDVYQFTTGTQSIRDYYGVPETEEILQVAFVFRSGVEVNGSYKEGKTETGGDIFAEVYGEELAAALFNPSEYANLYEPGENLNIVAAASNADSLILYIDDQEVHYVTSNSLNYLYFIPSVGKHYIKLKAVYNNEIAYDSAYFFVTQAPEAVQMPADIEAGINYMNDSTVILALYAPYKENVFILGDFNNWEYSTEGYMYDDPDSDYFWKQLNNLVPGKEYVYQYKIDGSILVADPYAEKYLDPWNDQYITESTYPGLIDYPAGKTTEFASVLQTAQPEYNWSVTSFEKPEKTDLVIYELLVRDFLAAHDYQTLIDTIGYLKKLGINAVELMPVYEFEGNSSWGYNTAFHFAPDKYYGPKNDLKQFIDVCHQNGIAVIMDIVLNHVFGSSPFARMYWDKVNNRPSTTNPWLNPVAKHNFNVGYDFNHESPATKALTKRVVEYWIQEYKVDGYRFDLSKGFTQKNTLGNTDAWGVYDASRIAIWKDYANKIWAVDPGAYVILEHFADNTEEKELANYGMMLWGNLNHGYRQLVMGWAENSDISWISYKNRGWNNPHVVGYMESHDEERLMFSINKWGNDTYEWYDIKNLDNAVNRIAAASAMFYTVPGPKMLWQFGELGYEYSIDLNGRTGEKPIRWDYLNQYQRKFLYDVTAELINLKKEHDVFRTDNISFGSVGLLKRLNLIDDEMSVTVIANFYIKEGEIVPNFDKTGMWYDYFTGDSLNVTSLEDKIYLEPGEFRLYTSKKIGTSEAGLSINEKEQYRNIILGNVFPNPSGGKISIPLNILQAGKVNLDLHSYDGKHVKTLYHGNFSAGMHRFDTSLTGVTDGMYYIRLVTPQRVESVKFILDK